MYKSSSLAFSSTPQISQKRMPRTFVTRQYNDKLCSYSRTVGYIAETFASFSPTSVAAILDNVQDNVLRVLDTLPAPKNLDSRARSLVSRHRDLATGLLPDRVDLGTPLADDKAVRFRIGQYEKACRLRLLSCCLFDRFFKHGSSFDNILSRAAKYPRDIPFFLALATVNDFPMVIVDRVLIVSDER